MTSVDDSNSITSSSRSSWPSCSAFFAGGGGGGGQQQKENRIKQGTTSHFLYFTLSGQNITHFGAGDYCLHIHTHTDKPSSITQSENTAVPQKTDRQTQ